MTEEAGAPTGEGEVLETFALAGRGTVLLIGDAWSGTIVRDGVVASDLGRTRFAGPEFARKADGELIGLIIDPVHEAHFRAGTKVRFHRPD